MELKPTLAKTMQWTLPVLAVAAAVSVAALGSSANHPATHKRSDLVSRGVPVPPPTGPQTEEFPVEGVVLAPVPNGTAATIRAALAVSAAAADGIRPDVQSSITPIATLKTFTNSVLGQSAAPPFGPPKYKDILVWDVRFPSAPVQLHGPINRDTSHDADLPPCDLHVIVDATTAAVIEGFQDCP